MLRRFVTSDDSLIISLVATLTLMGRHVYHVYDAGILGVLAAIGLALATMQFVLRGRLVRGYFFATLDLLYNLAFFGLLTPVLRRQWSADDAPLYLLSVAIPVVLLSYAHEYAGKHPEKVPEYSVLGVVAAKFMFWKHSTSAEKHTALEAASSSQHSTIGLDTRPVLSASSTESGSTRRAQTEYQKVCPVCGEYFSSGKSYGGHIAAHRRRGETREVADGRNR